MPRPAPPIPSLVLATIRKSRGWTGRDLEAATGVSAKMISLYERGARTLSRERLETLAGAMGFDGAAIDFFLLVLSQSAGSRRGPPRPWARLRTTTGRVRKSPPGWESRRWIWPRSTCSSCRGPAGAAGPARGGGTLGPAQGHDPGAAAAGRGGRPGVSDLVSGGASLPRERGGGVGPGGPRPGAGPAGPSGGGAGAGGGEAWRSRLEGYTLGFLANAQRVSGDLPGAEATFARAWKLWEAGAGSDQGLLAEWRLLDREASFLRERRRFSDALDRLHRALAYRAAATICGTHPDEPSRPARAYGRGRACHRGVARGRPTRRWAPRAAPAVRPRFNLIVNLCHLGRYTEAELLLPEVQELALALRKELDLVRVVWLKEK